MSLKSFIPKHTLTGIIIPYTKNYIGIIDNIVCDRNFNKEYKDKFNVKNKDNSIKVNIIINLERVEDYSEFNIKMRLNLLLSSEDNDDHFTEEIDISDIKKNTILSYKLFKNNKYIYKIKINKNIQYFLNEFEYIDNIANISNIFTNGMIIYYNK